MTAPATCITPVTTLIGVRHGAGEAGASWSKNSRLVKCAIPRRRTACRARSDCCGRVRRRHRRFRRAPSPATTRPPAAPRRHQPQSALLGDVRPRLTIDYPRDRSLRDFVARTDSLRLPPFSRRSRISRITFGFSLADGGVPLVAGRLTELSTSKLGVVLSTETAGSMPPAALDTSWSAVFAESGRGAFAAMPHSASCIVPGVQSSRRRIRPACTCDDHRIHGERAAFVSWTPCAGPPLEPISGGCWSVPVPRSVFNLGTDIAGTRSSPMEPNQLLPDSGRREPTPAVDLAPAACRSGNTVNPLVSRS